MFQTTRIGVCFAHPKRSRYGRTKARCLHSHQANIDFVDVELAPPSLAMERRDNGEIILRSTIPLADHARHVGEYLLHWAKTDPARTFLAERDSGGRVAASDYGDAAKRSDAISQWLIDNGHDGERPVAALCDNCINMGLLKLGAMQIGIPFLPISPAYSLMSENFAKLKHVIARIAAERDLCAVACDVRARAESARSYRHPGCCRRAASGFSGGGDVRRHARGESHVPKWRSAAMR